MRTPCGSRCATSCCSGSPRGGESSASTIRTPSPCRSGNGSSPTWRGRRPGGFFLSEAFTRPKLMKALAKLGFTQSYTYFTWRTRKDELQAYVGELSRYPERDYYRPNFFVNTPDILPFHLQGGEPWAFKSRLPPLAHA